MKQAISEIAQKIDDLKPFQTKKLVIHNGGTSVPVTSRLKQVTATLHALITEKQDEYAKHIRDQILSLLSILMLLLYLHDEK